MNIIASHNLMLPKYLIIVKEKGSKNSKARAQIRYGKKSTNHGCGHRYSVPCFSIIYTTVTMCRRRHTSAWLFVFPSDTFFLKYARAALFPVGDICESAMRWNAQFNRRLPLLVFRYLVVFPLECSRGAHPAYLASDAGLLKRAMSPISTFQFP
ncbi:MAG: hypothetical protein DDT23_00302 [candidate division WS2 bacterium]|nr:hypothetical protein [Candidatus Lithacetigena glycinireducens]